MAIPYVPAESAMTLDFAQPPGRWDQPETTAVEGSYLEEYAYGGVNDPIRRAENAPPWRGAMMTIPRAHHMPEAGGWDDFFGRYGGALGKIVYGQQIQPPDAHEWYGMLPWEEKINIRRPRASTFSRIMDILTGNE